MTKEIKKNKVNVFCSVSLKYNIDDFEKWFFPSLLRQKGVGEISLCIINFSGKGKIYKGPKKVGIVKVTEVRSDKQLGFGEAFNFAFKKIKPKNCFVIINPSFLHELCLYSLMNRFRTGRKIGLIDARQLPFAHPKEFDKKSGEEPWASGGCMLINSDFFEKVRGFDENFWMYTEDVDLSWRAWLKGYRVIHEPSAVTYHYTGAYFSYRRDRYYLESFWLPRNFIYLLWKYWGEKGEKRANNFIDKVGFPAYFRRSFTSSYKKLKKKLGDKAFTVDKKKMGKLGNKIKVLGYNLFHKMRY